jgi:hypothetical protein
MSIRTILANLVAGNQPVSLIDQLFQDVWNAATMSCTASGTNVITLTPRANVNAPAAYVPNQRFAFDAAATSTGLVTLLVGSLATLKLFQPGGAQAGAGNIVIGNYYEIAYDPTLDGGVGGFIMLNSTLPSVAQPVQGEFKNLVVTNTTSGTAASHVIVTADQVLLWNASNGAINVQTVSLDINANAAGANGLDTGSFAINTWYYVWVIYNGVTATTAGLLSASATAPTMPSGFTYKARVGAIRAGAGPAFVNMMQKGRRAQYLVGTFGGNVLANLPLIANGAAGTFSDTAPVWAVVSISNFVPPAGSEIMIAATNKFGGAGPNSMQLAPNSNYGGGASTIPPPLQLSTVTGLVLAATVSLELESTNVSWASAGGGGAISALGWIDNL